MNELEKLIKNNTLAVFILGSMIVSPVMADDESSERDRLTRSEILERFDANDDGRLNRDEREDIWDRREDRADRREDIADRREDIRDRREDIRDAQTNYKPGTKAWYRDKREDIRDRREDVADRREDIRDRRNDSS